MERKVEIVVIGAGTAGLTATRQALEEGRQVMLVESGPGGTTCARVGCMPSKLLISAADHAHAARTGGSMGVRAEPKVDGEAVMSRVRRERDRFVGFVLEDVDAFPEGVYVKAKARFIGDMLLEVGDERVRAERIVIAVGSRPLEPEPLRAAGDRLIHNDQLFDMDRLPESVVVFGPGVIGLELGQALYRLGVRTRILGLSGRVGSMHDPELMAEAERIFRAELALEPAAKDMRVERIQEGVKVDWREGDLERSEVFDYALVATGRRSNLDLLNLDATSLPRTEDGGLVVDPDTLQVGEQPVFVAGDAAGLRPVLHEAADEGRIAGANAVRYPNVRPGLRRTPLEVVFTDPQMIRVGCACPREPLGDHVTGKVSFENQGRSRIMGLNRGLLHVYAEPGTGKLLGAEGIGPRLEHIAHLLAWCHQKEMTIYEMLKMPFYHPVVEEGLRTALREAAKLLR